MDKITTNIEKMTLPDRIVTFMKLGKILQQQLNNQQLGGLFVRIKNENAWFTEDFVKLSIQSIVDLFLQEDLLTEFASRYQVEDIIKPKQVGIVAAGNIPAVSFHDILCVFLSGHEARIKPSSSDKALIAYLIALLHEIDERTIEKIQFAERLNGIDALIATGSDNSVKHFAFYFAGVPSIIRSNRTSVALLNGKENRIELSNLGNDIFLYFGLGCRNVSKLYVPVGYDFTPFFESIEYWNTIQLHHKYNNNYDYNKSILLVNQEKHLDNGFLLVKQSDELVSPLGVLFFEEYSTVLELRAKLELQSDKIQAVVTNMPEFANGIRIGGVQQPRLHEFADGVDTMQFLLNL